MKETTILFSMVWMLTPSFYPPSVSNPAYTVDARQRFHPFEIMLDRPIARHERPPSPAAARAGAGAGAAATGWCRTGSTPRLMLERPPSRPAMAAFAKSWRRLVAGESFNSRASGRDAPAGGTRSKSQGLWLFSLRRPWALNSWCVCCNPQQAVIQCPSPKSNDAILTPP